MKQIGDTIYYAMESGHIINLRTSKTLVPFMGNGKQLYVNLAGNGTFTRHRVIDLVAEAYGIKKENQSDVLQHLDGDTLNNNLSNIGYKPYELATKIRVFKIFLGQELVFQTKARTMAEGLRICNEINELL